MPTACNCDAATHKVLQLDLLAEISTSNRAVLELDDAGQSLQVWPWCIESSPWGFTRKQQWSCLHEDSTPENTLLVALQEDVGIWKEPDEGKPEAIYFQIQKVNEKQPPHK
ncbi:hypothetical protein V8B97DRAFT_1919017 [Scleroderma yunnanense]